MMRMTECEALCALNAVYGLGPGRIRQLLARWGSAVEVCSLSPASLKRDCGLPGQVVDALSCFKFQDFCDQERRLIERHRVTVMTFNDFQYPSLLKQIARPPVVLYVKGTLSCFDQSAVAIVGSRLASVYGMDVAHRLARRLGELGIVVVSGLARGIDKAAHTGCLLSGCRTWAVLGHGLQNIFPVQNRGLALRIEKQGALISEFPMSAGPLPQNYPRRNRIVSGLSLGTVVVEAAQRSGALITSRYALEQNREVFAVPGPVGHPNTRGTHALIQQGARLVVSAEDILSELDVPLRRGMDEQTRRLSPKTNPARVTFSAEENRLLECVHDQPVGIDQCAARTGWPAGTLSAVLLRLEIKRQIKQLPGKTFVRAKAGVRPKTH